MPVALTPQAVRGRFHVGTGTNEDEREQICSGEPMLVDALSDERQENEEYE
jgi:hypothetical protein